MVLTSTATSCLREHVMKILSMKDVALVEVSASKDNLFFSVVEFKSIDESFLPIMDELKSKRLGMERTIIFCRRQVDCATLWRSFFCYLKDEMTEPPGHPLRIQELCLVDYYTGCTQESVRNGILGQFSKQSCLRILIATIAFGLGIDCPDIHFGVTEDVETYVQQVGRAGRDGNQAQCVMMLFGTGVSRRF